MIARVAPDSVRALERWENVALPVQPCIRDLRGEHVIFAESRVTGIVDYGAMADDHPAVDLARLLGDYAEDREQGFAAGLRSYRDAGGVLDTPDDFVRQLARTGALGSAIIWLRRICNDDALYLPTDVGEARFALVVRRIEEFAPI